MTLDLSRWQFGITTVFHFIFVPLTIGLALLLAIMQTHRSMPQDITRRVIRWVARPKRSAPSMRLSTSRTWIPLPHVFELTRSG